MPFSGYLKIGVYMSVLLIACNIFKISFLCRISGS